MDNFSIPERLEPVAPTENTPRQALPSDHRRRRHQDPPRKPVRHDDDDHLEEGEDLHNIDEQA